MPADKSIPHNAEAEQAILGSILIDNKSLSKAVSCGVTSGDFFSTTNQTIFRRMTQMAESGNPIDIVTLNDALQASNQLRDAGEIAYIAQLADGLPRTANMEQYALIVKRAAGLRRLAHAAQKLSRDALENGADLSALQARMRDLAVTDKPTITVGANGHAAYRLNEFMAAEFPQPDHLIEVANEKGVAVAGLIPTNLTSMVFSMPHHLKSYFTTTLALTCSTAGIKLGKLLVKKPVRTYLIQMEDFPGQLQERIRKLSPYMDIDPENICVLPRRDHKGNNIDVKLPDARTSDFLKQEFEWFKPDLVIFDVLRRIINVDPNSTKESGIFLEAMDEFRYCASEPHVMLVHHENRKEADLMYASAGNYNFPGWANVMMQFKRKRQDEDGSSKVEIEVDNKVAQSPEPMRMVLDLKSENPVRLENLEETDSVNELRDALGQEWTMRDLMEVMSLPKATTTRRLKKLMAAGIVEKVAAGKRGRQGGLARYHFIGSDA